MLHKTVEGIPEIKKLVDAGVEVYAGSLACRVIKDKFGRYLLKCGNHCVGLHGAEGTKYENELNGSDFFILEKEDQTN